MKNSNTVLSTLNTGNDIKDSYISDVISIVQLIDYNEEPSIDFCEKNFSRSTTVKDAVNQWFNGKNGVSIALLSQSYSAYDFEISGNPKLRRVTIPKQACEASVAALYYGEGEVANLPFKGDITSTIFLARGTWDS
jgi:hypothetical protein